MENILRSVSDKPTKENILRSVSDKPTKENILSSVSDKPTKENTLNSVSDGHVNERKVTNRVAIVINDKEVDETTDNSINLLMKKISEKYIPQEMTNKTSDSMVLTDGAIDKLTNYAITTEQPVQETIDNGPICQEWKDKTSNKKKQKPASRSTSRSTKTHLSFLFVFVNLLKFF